MLNPFLRGHDEDSHMGPPAYNRQDLPAARYAKTASTSRNPSWCQVSERRRWACERPPSHET